MRGLLSIFGIVLPVLSKPFFRRSYIGNTFVCQQHWRQHHSRLRMAVENWHPYGTYGVINLNFVVSTCLSVFKIHTWKWWQSWDDAKRRQTASGLFFKGKTWTESRDKMDWDYWFMQGSCRVHTVPISLPWLWTTWNPQHDFYVGTGYSWAPNYSPFVVYMPVNVWYFAEFETDATVGLLLSSAATLGSHFFLLEIFNCGVIRG